MIILLRMLATHLQLFVQRSSLIGGEKQLQLRMRMQDTWISRETREIGRHAMCWDIDGMSRARACICDISSWARVAHANLRSDQMVGEPNCHARMLT